MRIKVEIIKHLRNPQSKTDTQEGINTFDKLVLKQNELEKRLFSGKISIHVYLKEKKILNQIFQSKQGLLKAN